MRQKAEWNSNRKCPGKDIAPEDTPQDHVPHDLLPLSRPHLPQFHHFTIIYSNFELINELNPLLGQNI
jgi:hypothetical protein